MNALAFYAIQEVPAQAFLAILAGVGVIAHMVWADKLVIVGREDNTAGMALLAPFLNFQDNAGCQLIVEVCRSTIT